MILERFSLICTFSPFMTCLWRSCRKEMGIRGLVFDIDNTVAPLMWQTRMKSSLTFCPDAGHGFPPVHPVQ